MPPPRTHITSPCPHHHHCRTLPPAPSPISSSGHHYRRRWHCGGLPVHRRCARGFAFIMYDALVPADHRQPAPAPNPLSPAPSHPMLLFGQASSTRSAASTASRPKPPWRAPRRSRPPTEHSPQNALCLSATGVPVRSAETKAVHEGSKKKGVQIRRPDGASALEAEDTWWPGGMAHGNCHVRPRLSWEWDVCM